jgi:OOP family OmpA-OmpF porin
MKRFFLISIVVFLAGGIAAGCAGTRPEAVFQPVDLTAGSGGYVKKIENFLIILDASGSMSETYQGRTKVETAVEIADRLNRTIPDMGFIGGVRTFGNTISPFTRQTDRIYGMTRHDKQALSGALADIGWAGGLSPMDRAAEAVASDLSGLDGKTALIFISDAKEMDPERPLTTVRNLRGKYGDRICIYTILVGNDPAGRALMRQIAEAGGCGFAAEADQIASSEAMAEFVSDVFLAKAALPSDTDGDGVFDADDRCPDTPAGVAVDAIGCSLDSDKDGVADYQDRCPGTPSGVAVNFFGCPVDSDNDGVADYLDRCPDTPRWTEVDAQGCPVDSDGDGVTDDKDRCPGTPAGARINASGCWVLSGVLFDTGKSTIRPEMNRELEEVAMVMRRNPDLKIEIQGHTDSVGDAAFNQRLSEQRARAVMNYLIGEGISALRLQARGLGETRPAASNDTAEGRAINRRVELKPLP